MTIAELFVKIGVTGSDESKKRLNDINKETQGISTSALAALGAVAMMVNKLKDLTISSASAGNSLQQFSTLTGMNIEHLQKYEYAAMQGGASAEDFRTSIVKLQDTLTNTELSGSAAEGMADLVSLVGFSEKDKHDMFYMVGQVQKLIQLYKDPAIAKRRGNSLGFNDNMIVAMRRGTLNKKNFDAAPIIKADESVNLQKQFIAWQNMGKQIEIQIAKIIAKLGPELIPQIGELAKQFVELAGAIASIAKSTKVLEALGYVIGGWVKLFENIDQLNKDVEETKDIKVLMNTEKIDKNKLIIDNPWLKNPNKIPENKNISPIESQRRGFIGPQNKPPEIKIDNINLHFQHDGKDHKKLENSVEKAVRGAFLQLQSQAQVV